MALNWMGRHKWKAFVGNHARHPFSSRLSAICIDIVSRSTQKSIILPVKIRPSLLLSSWIHIDWPRGYIYRLPQLWQRVVIVNGINLGRYWQRGPIHSLYCPKEFLKKGTNEIVIFETEGIEINELIFCGQPIVKKLLTNDFSEIGSNIHNHIDS